MECHKCEHRAAVEAGKYSGVDFEMTPCGRCAGLAQGEFALAYCDGIGAAAEIAAGGADVPQQAFAEEEPANNDLLPASVLADAMTVFFALPDKVLLLVRLRHQGLSYERMAQELNCSKKAIEMRFVRAMRRWPVLSELFRVSAVRRKRMARRSVTAEGRLRTRSGSKAA